MEPVARYRLWPCLRDPKLGRTYWERNWMRAVEEIEKSLRRSRYNVVRWTGHNQIKLTAYYWRRVRKVM